MSSIVLLGHHPYTIHTNLSTSTIVINNINSCMKIWSNFFQPCGLGLDVTEGVVVTKAVFRSPPSTDCGAVKIVCETKIIMKEV